MDSNIKITKKPTPTIEDYLSIIYVLQRDNKPVIGARLAELLDVSTPTVTVTLKRMIRDGWIEMDTKKEIHFTKTGLKAAESVVRRHMLTEWMLSEMLKIPWSQIHDEAHEIEHTISKIVEEGLRTKLGDPTMCPHGNPMPGMEDMTSSWLPLTKVNEGEKVIIRRIHEHAEDNLELMKYLETCNILPGETAVVKNHLNFNETMNLEIKGQVVSLGLVSAKYIFVEIV